MLGPPKIMCVTLPAGEVSRKEASCEEALPFGEAVPSSEERMPGPLWRWLSLEGPSLEVEIQLKREIAEHEFYVDHYW